MGGHGKYLSIYAGRTVQNGIFGQGHGPAFLSINGHVFTIEYIRALFDVVVNNGDLGIFVHSEGNISVDIRSLFVDDVLAADPNAASVLQVALQSQSDLLGSRHSLDQAHVGDPDLHLIAGVDVHADGALDHLVGGDGLGDLLGGLIAAAVVDIHGLGVLHLPIGLAVVGQGDLEPVSAVAVGVHADVIGLGVLAVHGQGGVVVHLGGDVLALNGAGLAVLHIDGADAHDHVAVQNRNVLIVVVVLDGADAAGGELVLAALIVVLSNNHFLVPSVGKAVIPVLILVADDLAGPLGNVVQQNRVVLGLLHADALDEAVAIHTGIGVI